MKRIKIDRSKCVGCLTCTTACIVSHSSEDTRSRITIDSNGKYAPIFCRHCDEPECVITCMSGAMSKDEKTLNILLVHWVNHNQSHEEGFREWVEKAKEMGKDETAQYIEKAIEYRQKANDMLTEAKKHM